MLNDGAAGLSAIKACGGTAIVQHPLDAQADQMPLAALEAVTADHVVDADGLAGLLAEVAATDAGTSATQNGNTAQPATQQPALQKTVKTVERPPAQPSKSAAPVLIPQQKTDGSVVRPRRVSDKP